jgi:hypothetical protein
MKKIILALLFMSTMFVAQASSKETPKVAKTLKMQKKAVGKKVVWELRFSCDGGNTWGTMCCFNSSSEATSFWNQNSAMLCGWTA